MIRTHVGLTDLRVHAFLDARYSRMGVKSAHHAVIVYVGEKRSEEFSYHYI